MNSNDHASQEDGFKMPTGQNTTLPATGSPEWLAMFDTAYGPTGRVALAYGLACRHAQDIRNRIGYMPLLLITGGPGTGKTTLARTLCQVFGVSPDIQLGRATYAAKCRLLADGQYKGRPVIADADSALALQDVLKATYSSAIFSVMAKAPVSGTDSLINVPTPDGAIIFGEAAMYTQAFQELCETAELRGPTGFEHHNAAQRLLRSGPWEAPAPTADDFISAINYELPITDAFAVAAFETVMPEMGS